MGKGAAAATTVEGDSAFARALASSDYHTRENGWKALQIWLQNRSQLKLEEVLKIWRGILFCFWHSDKAHVQQELAMQLASIICTLSVEVAVVYFEGFLATMAREWSSIDKLRLDKFMMLVRAFIQSTFTMLQDHKWDNELTMQVSQKLFTQSFIPDDAAQPIGFCLHLCDLYISELETCCNKSDSERLPHAAAVVLLHPFLEVLQRSQQPTLIARIKVRVFEEFASKLEQRSDEDDQNPFELVDRTKIGQALFACGARQQVNRRNRHVLYELAELYNRQRKSKKRGWELSVPLNNISSDANPQTSTPETAQQVSHDEKVSHVNGSGAAAQLTSSSSARLAKKQKKADAALKLKKKQQEQQKMKSHTQLEQQSPTQQQPSTSKVNTNGDSPPQLLPSAAQNGKIPGSVGQAVSGANKLSNKKNVAALKVATAAGTQPLQYLDASTHDAQLSLSAAPPQQGQKKKKKSRRDRKMQALGAAAGRGQAAASSPLDKKQHDQQNSRSNGLNAAASTLLANAVNKAVIQSPKKKISFNLSKNVYHAVGKPLPPPEIRTPPSARPSGSALKTGSSVMGKGQFKTNAARKLVY